MNNKIRLAHNQHFHRIPTYFSSMGVRIFSTEIETSFFFVYLTLTLPVRLPDARIYVLGKYLHASMLKYTLNIDHSPNITSP